MLPRLKPHTVSTSFPTQHTSNTPSNTLRLPNAQPHISIQYVLLDLGTFILPSGRSLS